jgi:hypothetical protein
MLLRRRLVALLIAAPLMAGPVLGHAAEVKKKGGGLSFIQLPTLTATVIRNDGRRGVLTVEAGIDVPNPGLRARADISTPRLRAAYVLALQTYASGLGAGGPPNADYISRMLQRETDNVLGQPGAKLLLGTILAN